MTKGETAPDNSLLDKHLKGVPMSMPLYAGHFYSLPERMLKRLPLGMKRLNSRNSCNDFQNAHTNSDTAVSLKVVVGGVRYRAQKRGQSNTYCQSVCDTLNECLSF